jgi:outer membrane protein assembly factor BamB
MTQKSKVKIPGPAIAVIVIAVCGIAAEYWLVPRSTPPPAPPAPSEPEKAPAPVEPSTSPPQPVPSASVWSTYHGGSDLTGFVDAALPDKPSVLWQYHVEGAVHQAPVGDDHALYFATLSGTVVSLDFNGKERWAKQFTRKSGATNETAPERFEAPVACFRDTLFAGAKSGVVYALNSETGEQRWTYDVGGPILGTVNAYFPDTAADPARVYVIQQDVGALHCMQFDTGKPLWRSKDIARCDGSAAVGGGLVVYGSCASAVHVFNALDGKLLREIELGEECQVANGPALAGDDLYVGSRSGRFFHINVRSGRINWINQDTKKEIFTTPALGHDVVVFGSEDGKVIALDRESSHPRWRFESRHIPTSPTLVGDTIVLGVDGVLQFLNVDTGKEIWSYDVSDGIASPAVIHGMVVVGSEDGSVMAFGKK